MAIKQQFYLTQEVSDFLAAQIGGKEIEPPTLGITPVVKFHIFFSRLWQFLDTLRDDNDQMLAFMNSVDEFTTVIELASMIANVSGLKKAELTSYLDTQFWESLSDFVWWLDNQNRFTPDMIAKLNIVGLNTKKKAD